MFNKMKYLIFVFFAFSAANLLAQQKATFDLATYTVPSGWKQTSNSSNVVGYTITNNQKGTYCQIGLYASTASKGSLQADFESEWQELIVKMYKPSAKPNLLPVASENGWDAQAGVAPFEFNGARSAAMLVTMSSNGRCVSIVIVTNTEDYQTEIEKFVDDVDLKRIEPASQSVAAADGSASILGTWSMTSSSQSSYRVKNGVTNYIRRQYTFNQDGTYTFITRTFDPLMEKILLGKESGTYQISGNNLTVTPQKSVLEGWSKKNGSDQWGNFIDSQNVPLEKVTYQFTKHYFSGIQEWNLVFQAEAPTKREGPFSNNSTFSNAYYYSPISTGHPLIELPGSQVTEETKKQSTSSPAKKGAFTYTTINFDDGWTSTVHEDWVQVTKGDLKVLLHYPTSRIDVSSMDYKTISKNAWDALVAPRYNSLTNFVLFGGTSEYEKPSFIAGNVTDNTTGKESYVALFKKGNSGWIEFITSDKNSFVSAFGLDISKVDFYNTASEVWDPLKKMANYNKFAVAAADLEGKWTTKFSGMTQYVNIYTGADAGASSHSSAESFQFTGNTYHWELSSATGMVGNLKFQGAKSDGKHSLPNNWQIHFSDLEGKPKTYNAYFSCVKGARMLWLEDTAYATGYTGYGKQE
jgi:Lipocalin-like domain